ncbi:hypothetical protein QTP70_013430 [Hemibagrus guttatus]|uniref:Reverse transcriptase/retrotransposon-derived protein RNase H-like domain-containing protein n=1 Tax=Hemibagrus guttatus TaxID=175788 RepID=A0AAE0QBZ9_9TELE|nr:hypothetical protein QTP70_013430 [Hemibagrus guttatus]
MGLCHRPHPRQASTQGEDIFSHAHEKKVTAVCDWPTPTTVKELQRFLGFANFYRRFINGYSSVTSPLTDLLRNKPKALIWTPAATYAFQTLKQAFTTAPLLVHPDPELPFIVEVDASTTGVGAVLSQQQGNPRKLHPCAFFSRKLNSAEVNYDIENRELLAVKLALEEWRHWLEGAKHPFTVLTDHKNLEYLRAANKLNPRQARRALFFTRFKFTISYRPGAKNVKADALSRLYSPDIASDDPEPILPENIFVNPISWSKAYSPSQTLHQNAHWGCSSFHDLTAPPSYTPCMFPWVLAILGSRELSRSSNNVSDGLAWQRMLRDTFMDAGSEPCLRAHAIFLPVNCCPFLCLLAPGHTSGSISSSISQTLRGVRVSSSLSTDSLKRADSFPCRDNPQPWKRPNICSTTSSDIMGSPRT